MSNFHHIMAESKRKTAFIKSFPVFKLILESARIKSRKFRRKHIILGKSKYDELVEKFEKDLLKGLSPKEVEMLKSLYEIVPPNATILFFDFLKCRCIESGN